MAFPRLQGDSIVILHNRRVNKSIKQERLHVFQTFSAARQAVDDENQWRMFCDSLDMKLDGIAKKVNRSELKRKLKDLLEKAVIAESNPIRDAALQMISVLSSLQHPLYPNQIKNLAYAEPLLKHLESLIGEKLAMLEKKAVQDMTPELNNASERIEHLYETGLELYSAGNWDEAKAVFLEGLKLDPGNIDFLYYAGSLEMIYDNHLLALSYFEKAERIGKEIIDGEIAKDPEALIKQSEIDNTKDDRVCQYIVECPDWNTDNCNDCENNPKYEISDLYSHRRFRPFFNALTSKADSLMHLKRYEKAIETLNRCHEYQPLWGTYNMMGLCYFQLGDLEMADKLFSELLWDNACYMKALIKYALKDPEASLRYLLKGFFWNPHIAYILIGREKPDHTRYIGMSLPDHIRASEFMHEDGKLFKKYSGFRTLIRCVLDDEAIYDFLCDLENEKYKEKKDRSYKMDREMFQLSVGRGNDAFLSDHAGRLAQKLYDPKSQYWLPEEADVILVTILEKKRQNWRVCLADFPEKVFYYRASVDAANIAENELTKIRVSNSWHYRKSLFVSGDII